MRSLPLVALPLAPAAAQDIHRSEAAALHAQTFATALANPWGLALLPDGRALLTKRPGGRRLLGRDGGVSPRLPVPA